MLFGPNPFFFKKGLTGDLIAGTFALFSCFGKGR
jgi:hypothetical protein